MTTTGDWRDRWEERDKKGDQVVHVTFRKGDGKLEYAYLRKSDEQLFISMTPEYLIPKAQPPKPKQYRPYTEAELWQRIQEAGGVLWVKERERENKVLVSSTLNPVYLHIECTHLDGSPFGMEVGE